jgi:HEAT repeat protein
VLGGQPTIGADPATGDATPEPDGGTRLLTPIPNPVCEGCATAATTPDGASIDPPSATDQLATADSPAEPPATAPASGPNPVVVDGVTCWRIGTDETWQLARDALGCESAAEFLRRHTDADGRPLRWFGIDHHGSPRQVRIEPDTVTDITAFCERFADGTAVRIETAAGARSIDVPVVDVRRAPDDRSSHDSPQVSALTAEAAPRQLTISPSAIDTVSIPPQPTVSAPEPDASPQQLDRYGRLATAAPSVVDAAGLAAVARTADTQAQTTALRIVASVLASTPTPGVTAIESLVACLDDGRLSRLYALRSLAHIAAVQPAVVADAVDAVIDTLSADSRLVTTAATRLLGHVADHDPGAVVDAIPAFGSLLAPTPTRARRQALATVGLVAKTHPDPVRPLVPQLCSLLETDDTAYRITTTAALGRVTAAYPAAATPAVPTLLAQLTADSSELRANTVGILGDIAAEYPTDIAPYTDELAGLLSDSDPTVRSNTAGAFARIAAVRPRHVKPFVDALVDLLDDSWTRSRVHACWALGRCDAAAAADALAERRHADPKESVRQRAAWALDRIA